MARAKMRLKRTSRRKGDECWRQLETLMQILTTQRARVVTKRGMSENQVVHHASSNKLISAAMRRTNKPSC